MIREQYVTKGYVQRQKKNHLFDAFGILDEDNKAFHNSQVTTVHRENVWHPYYEIKIEEEDLATAFRNAQKEKNTTSVDGV